MPKRGITADHGAPPLETSLQKWHEMHQTWRGLLEVAIMNGDSKLEARAESGIERCEAAVERLQGSLAPPTLH